MEFLVAGTATATARVGASTATGAARHRNQDALLAGPTWYVVADGAGGHHDGHLASRLVVDGLAALPAPDSLPALTATIAHVNARVTERSRANDATMATTVVGVVSVDDVPVVFHVGDSRCYQLVAGELSLLTRDHSYVQEMIDAGLLTVEAAAHHERRNVITRALGIGPAVQPDLLVLPPTERRLLLCSDGVSSVLTHDLIRRLLCDTVSASEAAEALVAAAVAAGSLDDATAVVVDGAPGP